MDLSFPPFDRASELVAWPGDLAALMVGVAARQGASPTAIAQAGLAAGRAPSAPASFNPAVAALLTRPREDGHRERDVHQNGSVDLQPRPLPPTRCQSIGDGSPAQEDR